MKLHTQDTMSYPPIEMIPADAGVTYAIGQGLVITANKAALVGATAAPTYICVGAVDNGAVPAIRVQKGHVYGAPLSAAGTALNVGDKVTIDADAIRVTATTTSGIAEIVGFSTSLKASGDLVYIRF